jgi:hypothetical protein
MDWTSKRERVRRIQASLVDARPDARPLTEDELAEWRSGAPMTRFAFFGVKDGVVYGEVAR